MKGLMDEKRQYRKDHLTEEQYHHLGLYHLVGINDCDINMNESVYYFKKSLTNPDSKWFLKIIEDHQSNGFTPQWFGDKNDCRGWYVAGMLHSDISLIKKSADAGYMYARMRLIDVNEMIFKSISLDVVCQCVEKNNPQALFLLGQWFKYKGRKSSAYLNYKKSADYFWHDSELQVAFHVPSEEKFYWLGRGIGSNLAIFARQIDNLNGKLSYGLGKAMYWNVYNTHGWTRIAEESKSRKICGILSLDLYCDSVDKRQLATFEFLMCWKRLGIQKDVGQIIAKLMFFILD